MATKGHVETRETTLDITTNPTKSKPGWFTI
jgi:hypothetical protein